MVLIRVIEEICRIIKDEAVAIKPNFHALYSAHPNSHLSIRATDGIIFSTRVPLQLFLFGWGRGGVVGQDSAVLLLWSKLWMVLI